MPRLASAALAALAATSTTTPVQAEPPQTITLSTFVKSDFVAGDLVGCELVFEVARNDPEYSDGNLVYLAGNLGFSAYDGKELAFRLKLGVKKIGQNDEFIQPSEAYLIDGYKSNASDFYNSFDGNPGFRIFLYSAGNTTLNAAVLQTSQKQQFTFAYAMKPGGLHAIVPVDLQVEQLNLDAPEKSLVSDKNSRDWSTCVKATLKAARERLETPKAAK